MLPTGVLADTPPTKKQTTQPAVKAEMAKPATMAKAVVAKPAAIAKTAKKPAVPVKKAAAPAKAKKKKPEGLVIGKNLKVGMSLTEAIKLLGTPRSIKVKRGTESKLDSISIEYANHGIVIHSLNDKMKIEALEVLPKFVGSFAEGIKIGAKVAAMIDKYGVPDTMNASLAKYPKRGIYFSLKENTLVSAQVFAKNSKLLSHKLYKH